MSMCQRGSNMSRMLKYSCSQSSDKYSYIHVHDAQDNERWGAGVETQKYVRGDIGGWGRVPSNETYAPSLSTIYDGA